MNRHPVIAFALLAGLLVVPASMAPPASAATGATARVSVATGGTQANNNSDKSAISADGRYVAFDSSASNLVAGDTNGVQDVFVRDQVSGYTTRVSVDSGGAQANGVSNSPAISADGRYIAYQSLASNLVAGDTNGTNDVFVRDRVTGATTRVSVPAVHYNPDGGSYSPAISADGRYVAFYSVLDLLGDLWTVYVHDRVAGTTTRVDDGTPAGDNTASPALSADGRYVAFDSVAINPNGTDDVFVRDRVTGVTTRVSVATDGTRANNISQRPAISADGRSVAFTSAASNLVPGDTNSKTDVFVRDRFAPGLAAVTRLSDFNRDGVTDLIARDAAGRLWLYRGNGSGYFQTRRQMGVGWNTVTAIVTPGDVTGDRNGDVIGRDTAGRLWLYPGNGASGFLSKRQIGTGWNIMAAITNAANLNGIGRPDLLARDTTGALWLYPLTGNAVFGSRSKVGTGWNGYTILGPGDVSGEGRADIQARDPAGSLWLYRGNGTGLVGGRTLVSTGWAPMTAVVTPGNWDLAAGNDLLARDAAGALWLYPGNNAGALGQPRQIGRGWQGMTYLG